MPNEETDRTGEMKTFNVDMYAHVDVEFALVVRVKATSEKEAQQIVEHNAYGQSDLFDHLVNGLTDEGVSPSDFFVVVDDVCEDNDPDSFDIAIDPDTDDDSPES